MNLLKGRLPDSEQTGSAQRVTMGKISITYNAEDRFHGELTMKISASNFSGNGAAWINLTQLEDFYASLNLVCAGEAPEAIITGGIWRDDVLVEPRVSLRILPHNLTGTLRLECLVAKAIPYWETGAVSRLETYFFSTHNDIQTFGNRIANIARGGGGLATIDVFERPDYSR